MANQPEEKKSRVYMTMDEGRWARSVLDIVYDKVARGFRVGWCEALVAMSIGAPHKTDNIRSVIVDQYGGRQLKVPLIGEDQFHPQELTVLLEDIKEEIRTEKRRLLAGGKRPPIHRPHGAKYGPPVAEPSAQESPFDPLDIPLHKPVPTPVVDKRIEALLARVDVIEKRYRENTRPWGNAVNEWMEHARARFVDIERAIHQLQEIVTRPSPGLDADGLVYIPDVVEKKRVDSIG